MTVFDDWFEQVGIPSLFDQFSESVTYTPVNGDAPSTVSAIVKRRQVENAEQQTHDSNEEFEVELLKDPDNADYGGIAYLRVGDKIKRSVTAEPDERELAFSGRIIEESDFSTIAIFVRKVRNAQGRGR
jgi:hypothetical protein